LKLDGVASAGGLAQFDQGVREARVRFFLALGESRIATIVATTPSDAPTTTAGYIRLAASACEAAIVRRQLLPKLAVAFVEGSSTAQQTWNEEGMWRFGSQLDLDAELKRLDAQISEWLDFMAGTDPEEVFGEAAALIEPDVKPDLPGASVFSVLRNPLNPPRPRLV